MTSPSTTSSSTTATPAPTISTTAPSSSIVPSRVNTNRGGSAREEHSRSFGFRPPSCSRRSQGRPNAPYSTSGKRKQAAWTRSFVCLAKKDKQNPSSTEERIKLTLCGLGEKTLTVPSNGNSTAVHTAILGAFPALEEAGGYEILRTGDGRSKDFILLPTPSLGFTGDLLKSVLGQAKAYIRPLQRDIPLGNFDNSQDVLMKVRSYTSK